MRLVSGTTIGEWRGRILGMEKAITDAKGPEYLKQLYATARLDAKSGGIHELLHKLNIVSTELATLNAKAPGALHNQIKSDISECGALVAKLAASTSPSSPAARLAPPPSSPAPAPAKLNRDQLAKLASQLHLDCVGRDPSQAQLEKAFYIAWLKLPGVSDSHFQGAFRGPEPKGLRRTIQAAQQETVNKFVKQTLK